MVGMWDRVFHQNDLKMEEPKLTRSQVFWIDLQAIGSTLKAWLIHGMVKDIHAVSCETVNNVQSGRRNKMIPYYLIARGIRHKAVKARFVNPPIADCIHVDDVLFLPP